jgi:hypothetical protein
VPSRRQSEKAKEQLNESFHRSGSKTVVNTHRMFHRAWKDFAARVGEAKCGQ